MNTFGASGPLKVLQDEFGFRKENIVAAAKEQLRGATWRSVPAEWIVAA